MIQFRAVTTCHAAGWQLYGRRMAKTFLMYWPKIGLDFYAEGFKPDNALLRSLPELPEWQVAFKKRHCENPLMNGHCGPGQGLKYDLTHDAVRFSHKVGAVIDTVEDMLGFREHLDDSAPDVVIWIDADVMTHAPVTQSFLEGLVKDWDNTAVAWLDRAKKYPECGFVMFNLAHPAMEFLIGVWKQLYTDDLLIKLNGWTDCHTLQEAVRLSGAPTASLSGEFTNAGHPFVNGPLGAVMDHLKGDRKKLGKSQRHDFRLRRRETYWRER